MRIVGELINSSRPAVKRAIQERDGEYIQSLALLQKQAGAHWLDVNCGTFVTEEEEVMLWLLNQVQATCDLPLCIDTPDAKVLTAALKLIDKPGQLINSISFEKKRLDGFLPLIREYRPAVVALCLEDQGIPKTAADRLRIATALVETLQKENYDLAEIYLDPLITPLSTSNTAGQAVLDTIAEIRAAYPDVHCICGLSNISFGLPQRKTLNATFMVQTMVRGMDAYILDPTDRELMGLYYASKALLGQDKYCGDFLRAYRTGLFNPAGAPKEG
ncbi:MAG: methyltetrahydrofolate cobalamin methyltransferase [Thermacetogeniaceae bacterium]